jgi:hypothetical protein
MENGRRVESGFAALTRDEINTRSRVSQILIHLLVTPVLVSVVAFYPVLGQTGSLLNLTNLLDAPAEALNAGQTSIPAADGPDAPAASADLSNPAQAEQQGLVRRGV